MNATDSNLTDIDELVFINKDTANRNISLSNLQDLISTLNAPLNNTLLRLVKYTVIGNLIFFAYLFYTNSSLPIDTLLNAIAGSLLLALITKYKLKYNTTTSILNTTHSVLRDNRLYRISNGITLLVALVFAIIATYAITMDISEVNVELIILGVVVFSYLQICVQLFNTWLVSLQDLQIKDKIKKDKLTPHERQSIVAIDNTGSEVAIDAIVYSKDGQKIHTTTFNPDRFDTVTVEQPDIFTPEIDRTELESNESVIKFDTYKQRIIGHNFDLNKQVKLSVTPVQDTQVTNSSIIEQIQKGNPYYLTADEIETLKQNDLLEEYFEKYDS